MAREIGLTRAVKLPWLKRTVEYQNEGLHGEELKAELSDYLSFEFDDKDNQRKARDIILRIWEHNEEERADVREIGRRVAMLDKPEASVSHWCMLMLEYPLFCDAAGFIGRVGEVQDSFTSAWLKQRMFENWGERATVQQAIRKLLQTMKELGALTSPKVGYYEFTPIGVYGDDAKRLLVLTTMRLSDRAYIEPDKLCHQATLYPFEYEISQEWLIDQGFELTRFDGVVVVVNPWYE